MQGRLATSRLLCIATFALAAAGSSPAMADWLVLRDGSRIETRGPWQQRGEVLVFHLANGTLASLRAGTVDLEASAAATRAAVEAAQRKPEPAPPPVKKAPVMVITDADVARAEVPAESAGETSREGGGAADAQGAAGADGAETGQAAAAAPSERLRVVDWKPDMSGTASSLGIVGVIHNVSSDLAGDINLTVFLHDEDGALLATADAILGARTLGPNQRTTFRATFPGVTGYSDVRFETRHLALRTSAAEPGG